MKKILSILSIVLILIILTGIPARAIAGVDDLIIAGAAVMTFGLVGTLGLLSLQSAGLGDAMAAAASDAGQDMRQFAQNLYASYARSQNITAGQSVQLAQQGTEYLQNGAIAFNSAMSEHMSNFIKWAFDEEGGNLKQYVSYETGASFPEYSTTVGGITANYVEVQAFLGLAFSSIGFSVVDQTGLVSSLTGSGCYHLEIQGRGVSASNTNNNAFHLREYVLENGQTIPEGLAISEINVLDLKGYFRDNTLYLTGTSNLKGNKEAFVGFKYTSGSNTYNISSLGLINEGEPVYDTNLGVLDGLESPSDVNVLDPDSLLTPTDAPIAGGTIAIDDWLEFLGAAVAEGVATVPVTVDGAVTDLTMELDTTADIPVTVESELTDSFPVANETSIDNLNEYTLNLKDFFPFCIPFDLYDMLHLLMAAREAPVINWRFYVPGVADEIIVLDFSQFDQAAAVLRTMEDIAFAIGLAFATKFLIQGGD